MQCDIIYNGRVYKSIYKHKLCEERIDMKKKVLLVLSIIAIMTVLFAISVSAASPINQWDISEKGDGSVIAYQYAHPTKSGCYTITILGAGNMRDMAYPNYAPWFESYNRELISVTIGNGVTNISNYAFDSCMALESITIPEGVTSIGEYAFIWCESLTEIKFPKSLRYIGRSAFYECTSLENVVVQDGLEVLDQQAFYLCDKITGIYLPNTLTTIGPSAFSGCTLLKDIEIPDSVTSIGSRAFYNCESIEKIYIPSAVTDSLEGVFANCFSLETIEIGEGGLAGYVLENNVLYTKDRKSIVHYAAKKPESHFVVPYGVERICEFAFSGSRNLKSIDFPDTLYSICNDAFRYSGLVNVVLPSSLGDVGEFGFAVCYDLVSIVFTDEKIRSFGTGVFISCTSLKTIEFPKKIESLGWGTFRNCSALEKLVIPDTVSSIGNETFKQCTSLKYLKCGRGMRSIRSEAFVGCQSFEVVYIPANITTTDKYFSGPNLRIYCEAESAPSGFPATWYADGTTVYWGHIHTPSEEIKNNGLTHTSACEECGFDYTEEHSFDNYVCVCGQMEYVQMWDISSTSADSVMALLVKDINGKYSLCILGSGRTKDWSKTEKAPWYEYRDRITTATIGNEIDYMGAYAFQGCLESFTIQVEEQSQLSGWNEAWNSLGYTVIFTKPNHKCSFGEWERYTEIEHIRYCSCGNEEREYHNFVDKVCVCSKTCIESWQYPCCSDTPNCTCGTIVYYLVENEENEDEYTFFILGTNNGYAYSMLDDEWKVDRYLSKITKVVASEGVGTLGYALLDQMYALKEIILSSTVTGYGDYVLGGTTIEEFVIPEGTTEISSGMFMYNSELKRVVLPSTIKFISSAAFENCPNLKSIYIPEGVTKILDNVFYDTNNVVIYCAAATRPNGWGSNWNSGQKVVWGHVHSNSGEYVIGENGHSYVCVCGLTFEEEHINSTVEVLPTCTENGYIAYTCSVCAYEHNDNFEEAKEHSFTSWEIVDGTYHTRECACGTVETVEHVAEKEVVSLPTCTTEGQNRYLCECGYERFETIEATGHILGDKVSVDSLVHRASCPCGEVVVTENHTIEDEIIALPDCENPGEVKHTCFCGYEATEIVAANGHQFGDWEAVNRLEHTRYCVCGMTQVEDHEIEREIASLPTCDTAGIINCTCFCGYEATETLKATGHKYVDSTVAPFLISVLIYQNIIPTRPTRNRLSSSLPQSKVLALEICIPNAAPLFSTK